MTDLPLRLVRQNPRKTAVLLLIGLGVFIAVGKMSGGGGAGGSPEGGLPVEAARVENAPLVTSVSAVGTLIASEGIVVRPEISGRVSEIMFTEGQLVQKGQPLIRLDDSIYRAQLAQAEAEKALAERTYNRVQALVGRGAGTEQSRDEAASRLRTAGAALELAQASLDKTMIVAAFSGVVGIRQISLGDYVSPGQDLVSLQALDVLKADFSVPETALGRLSVGQKVAVSVTAYPDQIFTGEVSAIDPLVDAGTRSVKLRAMVPNEKALLRPGQFASVSLTLSEEPSALFLPSAAIWPMGDKTFVFRVIDGKATMTPVNIVARQADRVAVSGGVTAGDMVVTAGHAKIMMFGQGQPVPVSITGDPAAPAAPAPAANKD